MKEDEVPIQQPSAPTQSAPTMENEGVKEGEVPRQQSRVPAQSLPTEEERKKEGEDVDGSLQLCTKCHVPKRGHKCTGTYQPARQSVVAQRRLGKATQEAKPLFGIVRKDPIFGPQLITVHGKYDRRQPEKFTLKAWQEEGKETEGKRADHIWNDECEVCGTAGQLPCCYGCNVVYHERCLVRKTIPRGLRHEEDLLC